MKELKDLKPGDEVRYFSANERTIPRGGRPMWVHKVGRKLIKVVCQKEDVGKDDTWGVDEFRIETGSANDGYGHSHISTVEAAEENERIRQLRKKIDRYVRLYDITFTVSQLEELAALTDKWAASE